MDGQKFEYIYALGTTGCHLGVKVKEESLLRVVVNLLTGWAKNIQLCMQKVSDSHGNTPVLYERHIGMIY